jgi:hypothetical protein
MMNDCYRFPECRANFLHEYDACSYDRCNRLIDKTKDDGTSQHWIQFPLWLFETHNAVNTRLRKERIEIRQQEVRERGGEQAVANKLLDFDLLSTEQDVMWPPMDRCPTCWLTNGRWDEDNVYRYMRLQYWPEDYKSSHIRQLLWNNKTRSSHSAVAKGRRGLALPKRVGTTESSNTVTITTTTTKQQQQNQLILVVIVGLFAALGITNWYGQRQRFVQKGFHKKHERSVRR